jgi:hypothetical protein
MGSSMGVSAGSVMATGSLVSLEHAVMANRHRAKTAVRCLKEWYIGFSPDY